MTDPRAARRRSTTLALAPAVAALFGGSLAWAGLNDPLTGDAAAGPEAATTGAPAGGGEQADLAAQLRAMQARVAELHAVLEARQRGTGPASAAGPAEAPPPDLGFVPTPPPVHATTRAS